LSANLSAGLNVVLMLVFVFILTLQNNLWTPSIVKTGILYCDLCIIKAPSLIVNVEKDQVTLQLPEGITRDSTLTYMEDIYNMHFTNETRASIKRSGIVDEPINGSQKGIPYQYSNSELSRWIKEARIAEKTINNLALLIDVKVGPGVSPHLIQRINTILKQQKVGTYHLVTPQKDTLIKNNGINFNAY